MTSLISYNPSWVTHHFDSQKTSTAQNDSWMQLNGKFNIWWRSHTISITSNSGAPEFQHNLTLTKKLTKKLSADEVTSKTAPPAVQSNSHSHKDNDPSSHFKTQVIHIVMRMIILVHVLKCKFDLREEGWAFSTWKLTIIVRRHQWNVHLTHLVCVDMVCMSSVHNTKKHGFCG